MLPRFGGITRDPAGRRLLNEQSIRDLDQIEYLLSRNRLAINDLQFLVTTSGRLVVNDPMSLMFYPYEWAQQANDATLNMIRREAQRNMRDRSN